MTPSSPPPKHVIITKFRWAVLGSHSKDRDNARDVIALQWDALGWAYLHSWC